MSVELTTQRVYPLLPIENSLKHAYESQKFIPPYPYEKEHKHGKTAPLTNPWGEDLFPAVSRGKESRDADQSVAMMP